MSKEIWKPINGYDYYFISNQGRVKSKKGGRNIIRKQSQNYRGYYSIVLNKNNRKKCFFTHILVAKSFMPNPENKPCVNHKNGVKTDNRTENLEWCTYQENMDHAIINGLKPKLDQDGCKNHMSKFTEQDVINIRSMASYMDAKNIANLIDAPYERVRRVINHETYKNI